MVSPQPLLACITSSTVTMCGVYRLRPMVSPQPLLLVLRPVMSPLLLLVSPLLLLMMVVVFD